jgi:hypothetical protein
VVGVQRRFTSLDTTVYYSNSTDFTPPTLLRIDSVITGAFVSFVVEATDDNPSTVKRVLVLFRDGSGSWKSVDLVQTPGTNRWTGGAPIQGGQAEFFVQAVDSAGNPAVSINKGDYFEAKPPPTLPGGVTVTLDGLKDANGWFVGDVRVTITGGGDVQFEVSVDGQPFVVVASGEPFNVTGDGIHTVHFRGSDGSAGIVVVPIAHRFIGFLPPVDNPPMLLNVAKAGSSIPVKWKLPDAKGAFIRDTKVVASIQSAKIQCTSGAPEDPVENTLAAGTSGLRYDLANEQFVYAWKAEKSWAGTCRRLLLNLNDGTQHFADFKFK